MGVRRVLLFGAVLALLSLPASGADTGSGTPGAASPSGSPADPFFDPQAPAVGYVGAAECGTCHARELGLWRGSHHDLALAPAGEATVLGDFADAELTAHRVTSRFFRRDGAFYVHTDGPDGVLAEFPIRWTFGWYPLQQYLIERPAGRLQALGIAWDARPEEQGGQRWFHLYPHERMNDRHPLHWTAPEQTWNDRCADCHSTDLKKNYDPERNLYETRWAERNVACEACHGPGARHVAWARAQAAGESPAEPPMEPRADRRLPSDPGTPASSRPAAERGEKPAAPDPASAGPADTADAPPPDDPAKGLAVDLADRDGGTWQIDPVTAKPRRSVPRAAHTQTDTCAPCHSRRGRIWPEAVPGDSPHQAFRLALLSPGLYFPDGQIRAEVYVYGSFLQSAMYAKGVVCSDCHEPHGLKLRAPGNGVCARCHPAERYDSPVHHFHPAGGPGAACVDCHMPERVYMGVDARADHSLRVPRPDLTLRLGTPNACNGCHADKDAAWAAAAVAERFPDPVYRGPHFGEALHAADAHAPDARARLLALAGDAARPAIARASALDRLRESPTPEALVTVARLSADPDPLVRAQAVRYLETADLRTRMDLAWPRLDDPVRIVRLEAARVLAPVLTQGVAPKLKERLSEALEELVAAETVNADRPEAHLSLGLIFAAAGESQVAEQAYRAALVLDPTFVPAHMRLADLYRAEGREGEAIALLEAGLAALPEEGAGLGPEVGSESGFEHESGSEPAGTAGAQSAPGSAATAQGTGTATAAAGGAQDSGQADSPALAGVPGATPGRADLYHALGLAQARAKRPEAALASLERAARLAPDNSRYAFVYAVALDGAGRTGDALSVLAAAQTRDPRDPDLPLALVQYHAKLGRTDEARAWLARLAELIPGDPSVAGLAAMLDAQAPGPEPGGEAAAPREPGPTAGAP